MTARTHIGGRGEALGLPRRDNRLTALGTPNGRVGMAVTWTRAWWRWTGGPTTRPVERMVRVDGRSRADEPGDERQAFGRWVRKRPRVDGGKRRGDGCGRRSLSPTWVLAVGRPQPAGRGGRVGGVGRDASRLAGLQRRLQGIAGGLAVYDEAPDNVSSSTYSSTPSHTFPMIFPTLHPRVA
ncbi:hypothetical protein DIPPA_27237 [Diplonema papillatum]|nr:hypothetical protein DIPPA_27237 [Diplonema papillatum]